MFRLALASFVLTLFFGCSYKNIEIKDVQILPQIPSFYIDQNGTLLLEASRQIDSLHDTFGTDIA